ncbi:MAG: hypothetical protein ACLRL6_00095 [Clostridium sp.]
MLDMAGYRISRTHITIRRRVFKRARRQLIRGYRELKRDGTLRRERAQKIISYNSYIEQSDSFHLQERYHTEELLQVAHRVNGFYGQLEYQKRMEELHDLLERRCRSEAGKGNDGKSSGWRNDRQDGDNIKEYRQEDAKDRKMYRFDEVVFELPADSTITTKQIEDDFEKYWEYGKTDQAGKDEDMKDDEPDPESGGMTRAEMTVEIQKLQEKNEMLESCLLEMSELVYA